MPTLRSCRVEIEDRKEFAWRKDHNSPDWPLSIGARWGIEKATSGGRTAVCFGPKASNDRGCGCSSVLGGM